MKYVTIYLSATDVGEPYVQAAADLGRELVLAGFGIVFGGSNKGLMKVMADSVLENHGQIIGITTDQFSAWAHQGLTELIVAPNLEVRKQLLLERGDGILVFPGGTGTLDEAIMAYEHKKIGTHHKPLVFLNTDHHWQLLRQQLELIEQKGFSPPLVNMLAYFAPTVELAVQYFQENL